jgi:hypothetical protein
MPAGTLNDVTIASTDEDTGPKDQVDGKDNIKHRIVEIHVTHPQHHWDDIPDENYLNSSKWIKLFRGTFFQMVMLGG